MTVTFDFSPTHDFFDQRGRLICQTSLQALTVFAVTSAMILTPLEAETPFITATVYLWVERKQIPHLRVMGRNIRFLKSELASFRASFRQEMENA